MKSIKQMKKGIANISDQAVAIAVGMFIIAMVAGLAFVVWSMVNKTSEVSLVNNIIMETRGMVSSGGYGTTDYVPSLIAGGSIPSNVTVSNGKIYNKSGGTISVVGNGIGFIVTVTALSKKSCVGLASAIGTSDLQSTKINGSSISGEVTAAQATTACTTESNTLIFTTNS
jgi:hypothetical protein